MHEALFLIGVAVGLTKEPGERYCAPLLHRSFRRVVLMRCGCSTHLAAGMGEASCVLAVDATVHVHFEPHLRWQRWKWIGRELCCLGWCVVVLVCCGCSTHLHADMGEASRMFTVDATMHVHDEPNLSWQLLAADVLHTVLAASCRHAACWVARAR